MYRYKLYLIIFFLLPQFLFGFGKNKVIIKDFKYEICSTEHFDIYYYPEEKNIIPYVTELLEKVYTDVTTYMECDLQEKVPFFLYTGYNDFQQTNIVETGEGVGGVTEAFKNRFTLPYTGSKGEFEDVLRHEFTHVVQFDILYSAFWKSIMLLKSIFYPNWLLEGYAVYSEKDFDKTIQDMYLRDAVCPPPSSNKKVEDRLLRLIDLHNFNHLKPHQVVLAYKQSGMLIEYIAEEYGLDKVNNMLRLYRDKFDANSVLLETIGIDIFSLDRKFREWLIDKYSINKENFSEPETYSRKITKEGIYNTFNTNPIFLNNDERIAYITDRNGYDEIVVQDIKSGSIISLINIKNIDDVESIHTTGRGLSVTSDNKYLLFIGNKSRKDYIYLYNLTINRFRRIDIPITIIQSAVIDYDGEKIYFVGMDKTETDIYSMNIDGTNLVKLTDGVSYVSDVSVSNDNRYLVFSQEILTDSQTRPYQKDLMLMDLETKSITKLTNLPNDEITPSFAPDNKTVVFISDKDNIYNIYTVNIETKEIKCITKNIGGDFNPTFSKDGKKIVFSSFRNNEKHIYIADSDKFNESQIVYSAPQELSLTKDTKPFPKSRPYRLSFSTDLFYPFFYYSTMEGFFAILYWQFSDMTGNHSASVYTNYASYVNSVDMLDYQISYTYARFRPQFVFNLSASTEFNYSTNKYEIQKSQLGAVIYPLNKFNRIEFGVANSEGEYTKEHIIISNFIRDTVYGKYLEETSGMRTGIYGQFGTDIFGADYIYQNIGVELQNFQPLGNEQTIASRLIYATSMGRDYGLYQLGGYERLRINPENISTWYASNILLSNIEWRFPIVKDINYYMWYIFPDFFFKSFYGILFCDAGYGWGKTRDYYLYTSADREFNSNNVIYSFGSGIRLNTFLLQMFPLSINFFYSYSPINDKSISYFSFGTSF